MKKTWSNKWKGSSKPRKQRKYRANAPLHVRHKLVSSTLSDELRKRFSRRSMPLRKGDEVEIMRGKFRGLKAVIERVDLKNYKVYTDAVKRKKVSGAEIKVPVDPSNLRITNIKTDDKMRAMVLERKRTAERQEKPKTA